MKRYYNKSSIVIFYKRNSFIYKLIQMKLLELSNPNTFPVSTFFGF